MHCVAIRHVAFEDLGVWDSELRAVGYDISYRDAGIDSLADAATADLVVVLGGPIGVGDIARYPVLVDEVDLIAQRLSTDAPTVGVCLGAQLIAAAAGARVYPGTWELGWGSVDLTGSGASSPLRHVEGAPVLHWHGDTFDLPSGSTLLASTAATTHQAFQLGRSLALQFHAEADGSRIEQWLMGHTSDLAARGVDVVALRARTAEVRQHAQAAGRAVIRAYAEAL